MRICICDDDPLFAKSLTKHLQDFFKRSHLSCPVISVFLRGEELLNDSFSKDIVFLDIEMPGLNGITVGKKLKQANKNIILFVITSYSEYLDEAMRFHVFRYLSKPIERQRLFQNMKDALHIYSVTNTKFPVETKDHTYTVSAADIVMVEALNRKVIVHTIASDYLSTQTMTYWEKTLPENCFFQSHRSYIVNMAHISDFDHSLIYLCAHRFSAYLTKRKYSEFKARYLLYLESMR